VNKENKLIIIFIYFQFNYKPQVLLPTSFWWYLENRGSIGVRNADVHLDKVLWFRPYAKILKVEEVESLLIPININDSHWFLLKVDFSNQKLIVFDSIIQDVALYVQYFNGIEMWITINISIDYKFTREVSKNVLVQPVELGDKSCGIYTILNIVSNVCEVSNTNAYITNIFNSSKLLLLCSKILLFCSNVLL
jgi:hypothetical protein